MGSGPSSAAASRRGRRSPPSRQEADGEDGPQPNTTTDDSLPAEAEIQNGETTAATPVAADASQEASSLPSRVSGRNRQGRNKSSATGNDMAASKEEEAGIQDEPEKDNQDQEQANTPGVEGDLAPGDTSMNSVGEDNRPLVRRSSDKMRRYEVIRTLDAVMPGGRKRKPVTVQIKIDGELFSPIREDTIFGDIVTAGSSESLRQSGVFEQHQNHNQIILHDSAAGVGTDGNHFNCQVCQGFGEIVCCDGCPQVYHPGCIPEGSPSRVSLDRDDDPWYCPQCTDQKTQDTNGKESKRKATAASSNENPSSKRKKRSSSDASLLQQGQSSSSTRGRSTSQIRCVDCQQIRSDLAVEPCQECGNHIHVPYCNGDENDSENDGAVFCSTCRAVDELTKEEDDLNEATAQSQSQTDYGRAGPEGEIQASKDNGDENKVDQGSHPTPDDPDGGSSPRRKRRKRLNSSDDLGDTANGDKEDRMRKKKKKKSKKDRGALDALSKSRSPSPSPQPDSSPTPQDKGSYSARTQGPNIAHAIPAFHFYLAENRWKIERALSRKNRIFTRMPKGLERNELVAKEAAVWWTKLRPADHTRYLKMSMRDYESRIIEWKEDKNLRDMGLADESLIEAHHAAEEAGHGDTVDDDRLTYERHERLFLSTSVGSKPFKPEAEQSYNRVLLDLLHDMRFHPLPMFNVNRSEHETVIDDHNAKVTIPFFDVNGPIATSVGDECLGCSRGWLHFCPVLQHRIPAVEHRAKLQPPLSSWAATRVGLGFRPRLDTIEEPTDEEGGNQPEFEWRDSKESKEIRALPVLPSSTLRNTSDRADDIAKFIEETMAMKVPEPARPTLPTLSAPTAQPGRKLPTRRKDGEDSEEDTADVIAFKCGRCRTIVYNDTGCVPCRRAQLVINTAKRPPLTEKGSGSLKVRTVMLGRVQAKDGLAETQSEGDIAVSHAMLKERWTPSTILPRHRMEAPMPRKDKEVREDNDDDDESNEIDLNEDATEEKGDLADGFGSGNEVEDDPEMHGTRRPLRASRSALPNSPESMIVDRDQFLRENKKKSDELHKKSLFIACCGMLLALRRRDPLLLFAEPATAEGYSNIIKNPIDLGMIRSNLLSGKYSSLGAFVADARLLCENAVAFNPAGSIYAKTAKELYDLISVMQKRASDWMGAIMDAYTSYLYREESEMRNTGDDESSNSDKPAPDPFHILRSQWPQAVEMLESGNWFKQQIQSDFMRTQENETAYYGSLAVRRVATAAEVSLAPYTDTGGIHSVVSKRDAEEDEALRNLIDERVSALSKPLQLRDISSWREESVVRLMRKVQSRRLDRRSTSESGCSRCCGLDSLLETMKASNVQFAHPGREKKKGEGDIPRVDASRMYLTTGLGSAKTCQKIVQLKQKKEDPDDLVGEVCVSVRGSKIHGWGLFADQPFEKGDFVAEYLGEYVPNAIADAREKIYQEQRIQDYQFRLDDKLVIDATMKGGHGRYINHNCTPNCYAKIIPGEKPKENQKRVLIIALRRIEINEEITYDYQFPLELNLKNRIPCNCQSDACRGFMNWDIPEKGSNNRALLVQKRGANMRDRIRRLGRPLKRDEV